MGYEINSTWTKLREKDIKKLNEIINDEYCIELEIGRKLNIMEKFNKAFDKEIEHIHLSNIIQFMTDNNWTWFFNDGGKEYRIPNKFEIINKLKNDFLKHGLYHIIELNEKEYSMFSGGFNFEMGYNEDNYWVNIYFDIAHFSKD